MPRTAAGFGSQLPGELVRPVESGSSMTAVSAVRLHGSLLAGRLALKASRRRRKRYRRERGRIGIAESARQQALVEEIIGVEVDRRDVVVLLEMRNVDDVHIEDVAPPFLTALIISLRCSKVDPSDHSGLDLRVPRSPGAVPRVDEQVACAGGIRAGHHPEPDRGSGRPPGLRVGSTAASVPVASTPARKSLRNPPVHCVGPRWRAAASRRRRIARSL